MKPEQAFGLAVKVIGLIFISTGLVFLICGLVNTIAPVYRDFFYDSRFAQNWQYFLYGFILGLLGYLIIRCARHIVRFAYPKDDQDS